MKRAHIRIQNKRLIITSYTLVDLSDIVKLSLNGQNARVLHDLDYECVEIVENYGSGVHTPARNLSKPGYIFQRDELYRLSD